MLKDRVRNTRLSTHYRVVQARYDDTVSVAANVWALLYEGLWKLNARKFFYRLGKVANILWYYHLGRQLDLSREYG